MRFWQRSIWPLRAIPPPAKVFVSRERASNGESPETLNDCRHSCHAGYDDGAAAILAPFVKHVARYVRYWLLRFFSRRAHVELAVCVVLVIVDWWVREWEEEKGVKGGK